jgi:hypothetical protein
MTGSVEPIVATPSRSAASPTAARTRRASIRAKHPRGRLGHTLAER